MKKSLLLSAIPLLVLLTACGRGAPAETPAEAPQASALRNEWLEELPWEEDWTCLILGGWELEPEAGKEALHALLDSYDWELIDRSAEEGEFIPSLGISTVPLVRQTDIYLDKEYTRDTRPVRFHLRSNGDLYLNGTLRRPLGEGAGERLLEEWTALKETGEDTQAPPRLTLSCGEAETEALVHGTYSWSHITRLGFVTGAESDAASLTEYDWLGTGAPVLRAEGDVRLSFPGREPDRMRLTAFNSIGQVTVELGDLRFTPYAGVNTYALTCSWTASPEQQGGRGSCSYILLIDGDGPRELPETERVSLDIREADAYGCVFTMENREKLRFDPGTDAADRALLRRGPAGTWEWVKPLRESLDMTIPSVGWAAENSTDFAWDWSYTYGPLDAGEYCLQLRGYFLRETEPVYLRGCFTLEEAEPAWPGPRTLSPVPEELSSLLEPRSEHRWAQRLRAEDGSHWIAEEDYSLFRQTEAGELVYIPPKYHLPGGLNRPCGVLSRRETVLNIELAAAYGELPAGTYVLRRRLFRLTEEESVNRESPADRSHNWHMVPEERVVYGDTVFTLSSPLGSLPLEADPAEYHPYAGEEMEQPLSIENGRFDARGCRFTLVNHGEGRIDYPLSPYERTLYFLWEGEWFPLAQRSHLGSGMLTEMLPGGESREFTAQFSEPGIYGPLAPGTYRLVSRLAGKLDPEGNNWLVVQFRIREDGTGILEAAK